jgi:para-nitrobenzyl esterase
MPVLGKDWSVIVDTISLERGRRLAGLLITVIAGILIGGCGSSSGGTSPPPVQPPPVSPPPPPPLAADEAQTTEGVIRGSIEGNLRVFRGIRYAASPTGALRFAPAAPPASFSGTRDALQFGSNCTQPSGLADVAGQEDCLFLNIWSHDDETVRPVIVFLHGGGANNIGGNWASIEGSDFAENGDVIIVTLNRRLGALGYLAIDELVIEAGTAGNYATTDILRALDWLSENIAGFGGDPTRIMLAGQSAGAAAACDVLASMPPEGLINSAAIHSPPCRTTPVLNDQVGVPTDRPYAVDDNREMVTALGCDVAADVLDCLRGIPAEDIVVAQENVDSTFSGVIDGTLITGSIFNVLENSAGNIPLIIGSTADESRNIFQPDPFVADDADYQQFLSFVFEAPLDAQLYALYPTASYPTANDAFHTLMGDLLFNCRAEWLANAGDANSPVYLFNFARGFDNGYLAGLGATHTIDIPHLFGTFDVWDYAPDQQALDLTTAMQTAWRSLVADPTSPPSYGSGAWPAYMEGDQQVIRFDDVITIENEHRGGRCPALLAVL